MTAASLMFAVYFNPRSPHGERRYDLSDSALLSSISIHAPRTGSDGSVGGSRVAYVSISIHAPRTGSDGQRRGNTSVLLISIHAPRTGSDG